MISARKESIFRACRHYLETKLNSLNGELDTIKDALQSETKSTAGDKHETGRAMLQLERERFGQQLRQLENTMRLLDKIPLDVSTPSVTLGSLVKTEMVDFFMAIAIGKIAIDGKPVFCISMQSPIGQQLKGKKKGDAILFNGKTLHIIAIE